MLFKSIGPVSFKEKKLKRLLGYSVTLLSYRAVSVAVSVP